MYGWAGQRLKVYLTEGKIVKEETPEWLRREYLGCRGFNSRTLFDELKPGIDPLSPENVFIASGNLFSGTLAPCGSRWTVTCKLPESGTHGDGNGGGDFGAKLRLDGYDQVIVYGRSPQPVYLWIDGDRVELRDASHLWGKTTWETHDSLIEELGDKRISELTIGPAGENLVRITKVINDKGRAGTKGGSGAVMGSKNLKAIVVRGSGSIKAANPEAFYKAARQAYEKLRDSPSQAVTREQATLFLDRQAGSRHSLVWRNAQVGYLEGWEKITYEAFQPRYAVRHRGCFGCPTACTQVYQVKDGPYATYGYSNQHGTTYPFTARIDSNNLPAALKLAAMCDQLGLDTHSTGATISFAMECWQRGLLSVEDTDGLDLSWGNVDSAIQLVSRIAYRRGFLGNTLAEGTQRASAQIKGSEVCLNTTKGMECSSLSARSRSVGGALSFATAPVGGNNHRGWHGRVKPAQGPGLVGTPYEQCDRIVKAWGGQLSVRTNERDSLEREGIALAVGNNFNAVTDSLACRRTTGLHLSQDLDENDLAQLFSTLTGVEMDADGLMKAGERIFTVEKAFNLREGFRRKDDTLQDRYFVKTTTPDGTFGIDRAEFEAALDEYYSYRGWDNEGFPTEEKLAELNLSDVAEQLRPLRAMG